MVKRLFALFITALLACNALFAYAEEQNTPAPVYTGDYEVLSYGSRGSDVIRLQKKLIALGYLKGEADGIYGRDTEKAVGDFQYMHALKRDGAAGVKTLRLLYESEALSTMPPSGRLPSVTPAPTAEPLPAKVRVSYIDQFQKTVYETELSVTRSVTVTAELSKLPAGAKLKGESSVTVLYSMGRAYPAEIVFRFRSREVPETLSVPVRYTEGGGRDAAILYEETVSVRPGECVFVYADAAKVPGYTLISAPYVPVLVTEYGDIAPERVDFVFQAAR